MDRVKCMECGFQTDGKGVGTEAGIHWYLTGHNRWELILPEEGGDEEEDEHPPHYPEKQGRR